MVATSNALRFSGAIQRYDVEAMIPLRNSKIGVARRVHCIFHRTGPHEDQNSGKFASRRLREPWSIRACSVPHSGRMCSAKNRAVEIFCVMNDKS